MAHPGAAMAMALSKLALHVSRFWNHTLPCAWLKIVSSGRAPGKSVLSTWKGRMVFAIPCGLCSSLISVAAEYYGKVPLTLSPRGC